MALSEQMQAIVAPMDAVLLRADTKARREARFDIRQGSTITVKDARANERDTFNRQVRQYWKSYADELVRRGRR